MTMRPFCTALGGLTLTLSACVVAPPPTPMAAMQNCQQFSQDITVGGKAVPGYGVQCLQADGTWAVVIPPQATPPPASAVMNATWPQYVEQYYAWQYANAYPYPYAGVYPWYPYSYWPDVTVGFGWGWGGGGWHGGWGGWHGGWAGGGSTWHGGGGWSGGGHR